MREDRPSKTLDGRDVRELPPREMEEVKNEGDWGWERKREGNEEN